MTRYRGILAWLSAGHAVLAGLYWLLLQIPESNVWMLAASGLVVMAAVWLTGAIEMTASLAFAADAPVRSALGTVLGRAWMIVFPLGLFAGKVTKVGSQLAQLVPGPRYHADIAQSGPHGWAFRANVVLLFPK